nr:hypothetical protein CFP56_09608 [Quercus suber]
MSIEQDSLASLVWLHRAWNSTSPPCGRSEVLRPSTCNSKTALESKSFSPLLAWTESIALAMAKDDGDFERF